MEHLGWSSAAQAVILAVCTWYMRRGSKRDHETLKSTGQAQLSATQQILDRISELEVDMALVKRYLFRDNKLSPIADTKGLERGKTL